MPLLLARLYHSGVRLRSLGLCPLLLRCSFAAASLVLRSCFALERRKSAVAAVDQRRKSGRPEEDAGSLNALVIGTKVAPPAAVRKELTVAKLRADKTVGDGTVGGVRHRLCSLKLILGSDLGAGSGRKHGAQKPKKKGVFGQLIVLAQVVTMVTKLDGPYR
jgi:hypothetical protein